MAIEQDVIISTDKHWLNRPETAWSNTYEGIWSGGYPGAETARDLLSDLVIAESFIHLDVVKFSGARMAKYTPKTLYPMPDEQEPPYDPENTVPYITNATGVRAVGLPGTVMPKDTILWVNRAGHYGRVGTWEGRGVLRDDQVEDADGDYTLVGPEQLETIIEAFYAALLVMENKYAFKFMLMGEPLVSATYTMVGKKKIMTTGVYGPTYYIPIQAWTVRGARADHAKKKWYNRQ